MDIFTRSTSIEDHYRASENSVNDRELKKLTAKELKERCKEQGLKRSGNKSELLCRLLNPEANNKRAKTSRKPVETKSASSMKAVAEIWDIMESVGTRKTKEERSQEAERVKELLETKGVHANIRTMAYGTTLLNCALDHSVDMVRVVLEAGADTNAGDTMGRQTPMDRIHKMQEENGQLSAKYQEIKKLLLDKGAGRSTIDMYFEASIKGGDTKAAWNAFMNS
jgi:hypothetical protein